MFSAPLSRLAELRRGHLALCSNESQSTLHICQNHEQLVALSSLGSALPILKAAQMATSLPPENLTWR